MAIPDPATTEWVPIWNPQNAGPAGPGIIPGGTTGQILAKKTNADYDTQWQNPGTPAAHHATHEPGGSDAMAVDAAVATGSLRTIGTGAQQACAGNDSRLTNSRTPTAHHATHETGGADAIVALSGEVITTGTVADARLSANVALKNVNNNFSAAQNITGDLTASGNISSGSGNITAPGYVYGAANLSSGGGVFELARAIAMGFWQDIPFNAANFTAGGGGTWTVSAPAVAVNRYCLIGKTMHWRMYLAWFQGTSTVAGTVTELRVATPVNTGGSNMNAVAYAVDGNGAQIGSQLYVADNITYIGFTKYSGASFLAGNVGFIITMTWEIQ